MSQSLLAHIPAELHTRDVVGVLNGMDADCSTMPILLDAIRDAGGTEGHVLAMVRALIYGAKKADAPRLWYADWLDEAGEVERSAFIRCQVELARNPQCKFLQLGQDKACIDSARPYDISCETCELRRRERDMWGSWPDENDMRAKIREECPAVKDWIVLPASMVSWREPPMNIAAVDRGFVTAIRCRWADFLRHHAGLFWSPRQTVEVPCIDCNRPAYCSKCKDRHRVNIPRPFVSTAQPIETVRLTTWPAQFTEYEAVTNIIENSAEFYSAPIQDGAQYRFNRVKCGVCDGRDGQSDDDGETVLICSSCHGTPLNLWECEAWPGLGFVMPQPFGVVESVNPDGTVNVRVGSMV